MKTSRKLLSVLLTLMLLVSLVPMQIFATEAESITAFVTISQCGEIVKDKSGNFVAAVPVSLSGKASYTIGDALEAAHDLCYEGGAAAGYASYIHEQYGLSLSKLWGCETENLGYQVNRGNVSVMGLGHEIENGDYIDAYLYEGVWPNPMESYARFNTSATVARVGEEVPLTLEIAGYDEAYNLVYSAGAGATITVGGAETDTVTDAEGKAGITFDAVGTYVISAKKTMMVEEATVTAITAPVCTVTVVPDAAITVPAASSLFVGEKGSTHFTSFTEHVPRITLADVKQNTVTYYFDLKDDSTYNYRVTGEKHITYAGKFKKSADFSMEITAEMLSAGGKTKTSIDRDTSANNGYNVADIFLNINPQGYLKLTAVGDTYPIIPLRSWEAVDSVTGNYFIEPDFHYTVLDETGKAATDVVSVNADGLLTAEGTGTAIVLVTYDALQYADGAGGPFFGAIWPENTGVFVVSVGAGESGIQTGMTINAGRNNAALKLAGDSVDAEHDVIYFTGETGEFTFTPETADCSVSVANPTVDTAMHFSGFTPVSKNEDDSFTVPLVTGRNIVKLSANGKTEYQVLTAKKVSVRVNDGELVHPGDPLSITLDTLYHPANKLAGVYNMNALPVYTAVDGFENATVGGLPAQYNFASSKNAQTVASVLKEKNVWGAKSFEKDTDFVVPTDFSGETFTLSGGMLYVTGWGDAYGNHRGITRTDGKAPSLNADAKDSWLGRLPDIEIPVMQSALTSITLDTSGVKTAYLAGESFDNSGLTVTASYSDGTVQSTKNYTVTPEVLSIDTEFVTISCRGKTATVPVTVTMPSISAIAVTTPPSKTTYTAGEVFDPTGMVVTATYSTGMKAVIENFSYAPNRALRETDTEITVTLTDNAEISATTPVEVKAYSGGSPSVSTVTVYFTLLGDEKHGEPKDAADTHTMRGDNLQTWLAKTAFTVPRGSTVLDVMKLALGTAGIPYENPTGSYIESVRGLGEMDNGSLSGWMYTIDGAYPEKGVNEKSVQSGDKIVFHYTDDYSKEKSADAFQSSPAAGTGATLITVPSASDTKTEPQAPETQTPAESKPVFSESTFADVKEADWHYSAVKYVYENSLMQGTGTGFSPEAPMTRAMLVTVLHRLENPENTGGENKFTDVASGEWYTDAVIWAAANGIVNGVREAEFAPNENITREEMATIFHRYAEYKRYAAKARTDLSAFADAEAVSAWAVDALSWANVAGLVTGTDAETLSPHTSATRAQVATILMRFIENIVRK